MTNNFKEELFLKIYNDALRTKESLDESQRTKITEEVIRIKMNLDNEECSLEDFRMGDFSEPSLSDAVEKLAFELENDSTLYSAYRAALVQSMVVYMVELEKADTPGLLMELFRDISDGFLNKFISDAKYNKQTNESI